MSRGHLGEKLHLIVDGYGGKKAQEGWKRGGDSQREDDTCERSKPQSSRSSSEGEKQRETQEETELSSAHGVGESYYSLFAIAESGEP